MAANKRWRLNLQNIRMDLAAGKGYGEKAVALITDKTVVELSEDGDISKF